jgi:hypothetical protein
VPRRRDVRPTALPEPASVACGDTLIARVMSGRGGRRPGDHNARRPRRRRAAGTGHVGPRRRTDGRHARRQGDGPAVHRSDRTNTRRAIGTADPLARLTSIRDEMEHLTASGQADTTQTLTALAGLTAPSVLALRAATVVGRRHIPQRSVGTVTTNVRGPDHTLYAAGRKMVHQPFVPIAKASASGWRSSATTARSASASPATTTPSPMWHASADRSSRASTTCTNRSAARPVRRSDVVLWLRTGPGPMIET